MFEIQVSPGWIVPRYRVIERKVRPVCGHGQVLVRVQFAGVNFADVIASKGFYAASRGVSELVPGFEFSGKVLKVGKGVKGFSSGDAVFGFCRFGGYASEVTIGANQLRRIPKGMTAKQAAGVIVPYMTAAYALNRVAGIVKGERVVVPSAAGGVGYAACQIAANAGCKVIGVVGNSAKRAWLMKRDNRIEVVEITECWKECDRLFPDGIDVALACRDGDEMRQAYKRLRSGGRLVVYGFGGLLPRRLWGWWPSVVLGWLRLPVFSPFAMTSENRSVAGFNLAFLHERMEWASPLLDSLIDDFRSGRFSLPLVETIPARHVLQAHRKLMRGQTIGKLVLSF